MSKKSTQKTPVFDFRTIKTFEDACKKLDIVFAEPQDILSVPVEFGKPLTAAYKLMIIFKAINNGWRPDWSKSSQWKYYPWFGVLSSGFGFSGSDCDFGYTVTGTGSRLCTDSSEKALYIAEQFKAEYQEFFLYPA